LVLVGADNPYRGASMAAHLRELAGPFATRLHMLGRQPPERLFPALRAADVVALPSLWENFATAALEGMALGCPMVVSSGTGFDEFIRADEEALMVPRGSADELAESLLRLIGDPVLRQRLSTTAAEAADRFDVAPVTSRVVGALSALTGASA
jgi:glycosyltransferase involved in cell wall biosynthesis